MFVRAVGRPGSRDLAIAIFCFLLVPAVLAHRLDELLQATLLSVGPDSVSLDISLTPGVEVAEALLANVDRDRDGVVSAEESREYARAVLRSVALSLDGRALDLEFLSEDFAAIADLRAGTGRIQVHARAALGTVADGDHHLVYRNLHPAAGSVFLANTLLPESPAIQIQSQKRDELQTELTVNYRLKRAPTAEGPASRVVDVGPIPNAGTGIQRTMTLLASSTPERHNTVRLLFYGQSITEQNWAKLVENDLRRRFPNANLIVENRALGGFASQLLVKTAETDLYPFQPDLLIFHVYGAHNTYEDIIRRARERTTAEILIQTDHLTKDEQHDEETDPARFSGPDGKRWDAFMNYKHLPEVARRYNCALLPQRDVWKRYLKEHNLPAKEFLRDSVHLNDRGCELMAAIVNGYLVKRDERVADPMNCDWVRTYRVGRDVKWEGGWLRFDFEGSRLDLICQPGGVATAKVTIDGQAPSAFPELYGFTRAVTKPEGKWLVKWPVIAPIGLQAPLLIEDWTLEVRKDAANDKLFAFTLTGSKTGPDGQGRSDARFVSNSGRVTIETNAWNVEYALSLGGIKPVPEQFEVKWRVEPRFVDEFVPPGVKDPTLESVVTVAAGLPEAKHTLELNGPDPLPVAAIRIYSPSRFPRSTRD